MIVVVLWFTTVVEVLIARFTSLAVHQRSASFFGTFLEVFTSRSCGKKKVQITAMISSELGYVKSIWQKTKIPIVAYRDSL